MSETRIHAVVERFDGEVAVIETPDGDEYRVHRSKLPEGCRVGHHLQMEISDGQVKQVMIDEEAIARAKERIDELMARLRRGDHLKKDDGSQHE